MSKLDTLRKEELLEAAEYFGVDLDGNESKTQIVHKLETNEPPVTYSDYQQFLVPKKPVEKEVVVVTDEPVGPVVEEERVVLKMERENPSFQVRGYLFTKKHPYALVKESDADFIMSRHTGFRPCTPSEVREYYA